MGQWTRDGPECQETTNRRATKKKLNRTLTKLAGGHGGQSILKDFRGSADTDTGVPEYVIKAFDEAEASAYLELERSGDALLRFTARFIGEIDARERDMLVKELGMAGEARYMRFSNLMKSFKRGPHVMDCKIGTRSFREAERHNTAMRPDLYQRMVELDPSAPSAEENKARACTKHRWMSFRDRCTNLDTLGFRIDGLANSKGTGKKTLEQARTLDDAAACIVQNFLPEPSELESELKGNVGKGILEATAEALKLKVASRILSQLKELRGVMEKSSFVRSHEFVGSSLLFIADAHGPAGGAFLIDFAKVTPLPPGVAIDHRSPWVAGNHEDGLLTGMDNMIRCWEHVVEMLGEGAADVCN